MLLQGRQEEVLDGNKKYSLSKYNTIVEENGQYLFYNSFSGALCLLNQNDRDMIDVLLEGKEELTKEQCIFKDKILINNFLVPSDVDETEVLKERYWRQKNDASTMTLTILPTLACNFACNYCFQGAKKENETMSPEIQDRWLAFLENHLEGIRHVNVTWFGGEPTLAMEVIKRMSDRMIALCDRNKISYQASIITNGSLLTPELVGELYVRRVSLFQITFDGPSYLHDKVRFDKKTREGSFEKIVSNINAYSKLYPVSTSLRINVDSRNEEACFELLEELSEKLKGAAGVSVYFAPIHASTVMCEHISAYTLETMHFGELETKLNEQALKLKLAGAGLPPMHMGLCGAAKEYGLVAVPNGDIHKCWETVSMPEYRVGNIMEENAFDNEAFQKWRTWSPFEEEECRDCKVLPNCLGMCTYRFLHRENYSGNSALSPCPSLKFQIDNRLKAYIKAHYPQYEF